MKKTQKHQRRLEEPTIPQTINAGYNKAWEALAKHFWQAKGLPKPNLDMSTGYPRRKAEWLEIYEALTTILLIGKRQKWLHLHVDRRGRPVYLVHKA